MGSRIGGDYDSTIGKTLGGDKHKSVLDQSHLFPKRRGMVVFEFR